MVYDMLLLRYHLAIIDALIETMLANETQSDSNQVRSAFRKAMNFLNIRSIEPKVFHRKDGNTSNQMLSNYSRAFKYGK